MGDTDTNESADGEGDGEDRWETGDDKKRRKDIEQFERWAQEMEDKGFPEEAAQWRQRKANAPKPEASRLYSDKYKLNAALYNLTKQRQQISATVLQ